MKFRISLSYFGLYPVVWRNNICYSGMQKKCKSLAVFLITERLITKTARLFYAKTEKFIPEYNSNLIYFIRC